MKDEEIDEILDRAAQTSHRLPPEMLRRITDSIRPSLRPVEPLPPPWLLTGGLMLVCAAIAAAGAAHAGFFGIEKMDQIERLLIFPVLGILTWATGREFIREMIPGSRRRVTASQFLGSVCIFLIGLFALLFRDYQTHRFFAIGIVCLVTGVLHAIPAALLSWLVLRRGFAVNAVTAGLLAGMLGGLAGVGMLELHCPNFEAAHVLVWHTAVVPLSGGLGALAGFLLRWYGRPAVQRQK